MTQLLNQFNQTPEKGQLDGAINLNQLSVKIDDASVADFTDANGFAVTITDNAGKLITVDLATGASDDIFGFIPYEVKSNSYEAGDLLRVAFADSIMLMEASAAIARGADLEIVPTGNKVVTQSTGTSIGRALDQAAADGDLIRVLVKTS
jgi:hypothetical protein